MTDEDEDFIFLLLRKTKKKSSVLLEMYNLSIIKVKNSNK